MSAHLWPHNEPCFVAPTQFTAHNLRTILPYRSINTDLLYLNQQTVGFGLQLLSTQPHELLTLTTLLADPPKSPCLIRYSLLIYHYHSQPCVFLFADTDTPSRATLYSVRQYMESLLPFKRLPATDFLMVMRSLLSPDMSNCEWPGLLDIQNKPFHHIVAHAETRYTITPQQIDIVAPDAFGTLQSSRVLSLYSEPLHGFIDNLHQLPLWPNQPWLPLENWMIHYRISGDEPCCYNILLISSPQKSAAHLATVQTAYHHRKIPLHVSATPWQTWLASLPFIVSTHSQMK